MKRLLLSASLVMAAVTLSFAGNPKSESKSETKSETKAEAGTSLYWYIVTYNGSYESGAILNSEALYDEGEASEITSPCPSGTVKDCLRGFTTPLTSFPETSSGDGQIKKPN